MIIRSTAIRRLFLWTGALLLMVLAAGISFGLQEDILKSYEAMRAHLGELYGQKKYKEAAELLDKSLTVFPAHVRANTYNLAIMCLHLEQYQRGVNALLYGLERGVWYGRYDFEMELWQPYKSQKIFQDFLAKNTAIRMEKQKSAKPELKLSTPEGYDPARTYPLFIALHGGGENIEDFSARWRSDRLKSEFLVAYLQSSQVVSMDGFGWTEDMELAKKEIQDAFEELRETYPVDETRIIIGGFSSGGVASLETALAGTLPVSGFVVLCPGRPDGFTAARVKEAARRGIRGTLLTTEMDQRIAEQKAMIQIMEQEGLPCEFIVTPNIGHWYPEDLGRQIDLAVSRILGK
jgi:predicted esterase